MISNKKMLTVVLNVVLLAPGLYADVSGKAAQKKDGSGSNDNTNISIEQVLANKDAKVDLKVRYINTMEAMQLSKIGIEASKNIEEKRKELAEGIKKAEQKLTQAMTEFRSKESTLSRAARENEEGDLVKLRSDYESLGKASEDKLKLSMQRATEDLSKEVEEAVTQIAKKEGFDVVADVYTGRTVYASDKAMITGNLVSVMNQKHEKKLMLAQNKKEDTKKLAARKAESSSVA